MESIAIGEINQTVFDCPTCARPLALGARRCPGCGTHLVLGVPLAKASVLASVGLALGIAVGGVIGFGVGLGRNVPAAPALAVAASSSKAPGGGPTPSTAASTVAPTPSQAPSPSADPTDGMPAISRSALVQAIAVNDRLRAGEVALRSALAARSFDASAVAEILRTMSADSVFGQQLAGRLAEWPGAAALAQDLDALYGNVHDSATNALVASVRDGAAYRSAASAMIKVLGPLPALDAAAGALASQVGLDPSASSTP